MTNISVGTSFFIRRPVFCLFTWTNKLTHRHYRQSRFPWSKIWRFNAKKYTWHNIIKRERKDKSWNKNRNTRNPFFIWDALRFHRLYFAWETHSKHNSNTSTCLCRCLFYLQERSMPNLVSGQLCLPVQLGPNNHISPICQCAPSFVEYSLEKRTSTPTSSMFKARIQTWF